MSPCAKEYAHLLLNSPNVVDKFLADLKRVHLGVHLEKRLSDISDCCSFLDSHLLLLGIENLGNHFVILPKNLVRVSNLYVSGHPSLHSLLNVHFE